MEVNIRKTFVVIACIAIWMFSLSSCLCANETNDVRPSSSPATLREGQVVRLEGSFQGWKALECSFPEDAAPNGKTRSDWLIRVGPSCYYVTGGSPDGLEAYNPEHIGIRISLEARPIRNEKGKLLLEYISSKRIM